MLQRDQIPSVFLSFLHYFLNLLISPKLREAILCFLTFDSHQGPHKAPPSQELTFCHISVISHTFLEIIYPNLSQQGQFCRNTR